MPKTFLRYLTVLLCLLFVGCSAPSSDTSFKVGKEYELITSTTNVPIPAENGVKVIEFFSYGCPWCYRLEPYLEKWVAAKPKDIAFERVHVTFETGWDTLAKIYYTAKNLGVEQKMMMPLFTALQEKNMDLTNPAVVAQIFAAQGVSQQDFESQYNFSPGVDGQIQRGEQVMRGYGVFAVPTFVVGGKYVTNMAMAQGDVQRLLKIVDFLIAKVKAGEH